MSSQTSFKCNIVILQSSYPPPVGASSWDIVLLCSSIWNRRKLTAVLNCFANARAMTDVTNLHKSYDILPPLCKASGGSISRDNNVSVSYSQSVDNQQLAKVALKKTKQLDIAQISSGKYIFLHLHIASISSYRVFSQHILF